MNLTALHAVVRARVCPGSPAETSPPDAALLAQLSDAERTAVQVWLRRRHAMPGYRWLSLPAATAVWALPPM
jgi:hypothetical protein